MKRKKVKIGIVGCGAIGSRLAESVLTDLKNYCQLSGLYDINRVKSEELAEKLVQQRKIKSSLRDLIDDAHLVVEAVNSNATRAIVRETLNAKKNILVMSVGKLLNARALFHLAKKNKCQILIPSGAIAGLDALKAGRLANIKNIRLTTRKPLSGFAKNDYVAKRGIALEKIDQETTIYEGGVDDAVKFFPKNINVAATLCLACGDKRKVQVRITTSPEFKTNRHEIEINGDFGRITTCTDNTVCPDNPKTSYLAVLSALQVLREFLTDSKIVT